jgi:membrane protease YdiL (CAAX protease family)
MAIWSRVRAALSLKDTPIGDDLPRPLAFAMAAIGLAATAIDLDLIPHPLAPLDFDDAWPRILPSLIAVGLFALLLRRSAPLGLRVAPLPSPGYWVRGTIGMAVVFSVVVGISVAVYVAMHGVTWPAEMPPPDAGHLPGSLIHAPLVEELVYRWVLVTGLAALGLRWIAVLVSGLAFGWLHLKYGAAAPNNVVAGFVFAWMYLKSGHIGMPVFFHSLGNALVYVANVVMYRIVVG